jgi:hypothetical protein
VAHVVDLSTADAQARQLDAIAKRLEELTLALERQHDPRCVFTYAYAIMTRRIREELPGQADVDGAWVTGLATAFAGRYFAAVEAYDRGEMGSGAWYTVFEALWRRHTSPLEDLVFAMTAHIAHDLPLALLDVSPPAGPASDRIADFHAVNDMMTRAVEKVQDEIAHRYSRGIGWLDRLAEQYDEILTSYGVRMGRGLAWYNAIRIADPRAHASGLAAIEKSPRQVVEAVLHPPKRSLRLLVRLIRLGPSYTRRWPADDPAPAVQAAVRRARAPSD